MPRGANRHIRQPLCLPGVAKDVGGRAAPTLPPDVFIRPSVLQRRDDHHSTNTGQRPPASQCKPHTFDWDIRDRRPYEVIKWFHYGNCHGFLSA